MKEKKSNIYKEEEQILEEARSRLNKELSEKEWSAEYKKLVNRYDELLENLKLITSISDRFQKKYKDSNDKLKEQTDRIIKMNLELDADNRSLKSNISELTQARALKQVVGLEEFRLSYPNKHTCLKFLADLKWEKGYICQKCGNDKYCDGNMSFARRCTRCRYDESPTAFTLLHKCKFDIVKAFYMVMIIHSFDGKISSYELARLLDLRQKTCWSFKQKVLEAIEAQNRSKSGKFKGWAHLVLNPSKNLANY